jgi:type IV pilus assembly protein PilX
MKHLAEHRALKLPRDRGVALVVALIMLLLLTILGINSVQNSIMEERMAGNSRDRQVAFEAAEAALRVAEARLLDQTQFNAIKWDATDGSHEGDPSLDPFTSSHNKTSVTDATLNAETVQNPQYYIERLPEIRLPGSSLVVGYSQPAPTIRFYRVTAYGYGKTSAAEVIMQSAVY